MGLPALIKKILLAAALLCASLGADAAIRSRQQNAIAGCSNCMITPLLSVGGSNAAFPSNTVANFMRVINGPASSPTATLGLAQTPFPVNGQISNLSVSFPTTILTGTNPSTCNGVSEPGSCYAIQLEVGGSLQTLGCNVFTGQQTCTDNTHVISVSAGNLVNWAITPTNSPTVQAAQLQISAVFTSTVGQESAIFMSSGNLPSASAIQYHGFGGTQTWGATENLMSSVVPTGGVLDQMYLAPSGLTGSGATMTGTVFLNGSATSLTCTTAVNSSAQCTDLNVGHAITVAQGDTISVQSCPSNTATCPAGSVPSNRSMFVGLRWVPTTSNEALMFDNASTIPGISATRWGPINGSSNNVTTTELDTNIVPTIAGGMTIKKLTELQAPAPGGSTSRVITLRAGQASVGTPGNVSCTVTSAATTCTDNTNSYSAATGALLDWQWATAGGNNATLTRFAIGAVVTVP